MTCLQEIFHGPYFPAEQDPKWYRTAEPVDGPTMTRMREVAKEHAMVLVVPWFEEAQTGVYYNAAAVIEADGTLLGTYRKTHIPHVGPCFWEKFYFKPGNLGYPVFDTSVGKIGLMICYDRHFPEVARQVGAEGRRDRVQPVGDRRVALEVPVGARAAGPRGRERLLDRGDQPGRRRGAAVDRALLRLLVLLRPARADRRAGLGLARTRCWSTICDLDMIREVRDTWQFMRDRRPETYGELTELLP